MWGYGRERSTLLRDEAILGALQVDQPRKLPLNTQRGAKSGFWQYRNTEDAWFVT
jgi:hypothetical protein